jgi:IS605 OrfB family transposase
MKLTIHLKLITTSAQDATLRDTLQRFNAATTFAAQIAFDTETFTQPSIQKLCYRDLRERFGLSSQMAIRAIGKAVDCFRRDRSKCPAFRKDGAAVYDERILSFKPGNTVSLLTVGAGRLLLPYVCGAYQAARLPHLRGQSDLILRDGTFYLYCTVEVPEPEPIEVADVLGVDLGIANLAVDSDGEVYSGEHVEKVRRRFARTRRRLQRKGTRSAKRILQRIRRRESRFRAHTNHVISKKLVAAAKGTTRAIAVEDLKGIRSRVTVGRRHRAKHSGWAFLQLRSFIEYKAKWAGIPVIAVDPRDSSRTCSQCGHCDRANRKSQAEFVCLHCGYTCHADFNGARNVRARALVTAPHKGRKPGRPLAVSSPKAAGLVPAERYLSASCFLRVVLPGGH